MSILISLIREIFSSKPTSQEIKAIQLLSSADGISPASKRKVLNVGGNSKLIELPPQYHDWEQVLLDIDPRGEPDIVCDARELAHLPRSQFDAVYCSHNLEHYYRHDAVKVLSGFLHVLKEDGFVHIRVPDIGELMRTVVRNNLDIDSFLYESPAGPITVRDVIYGYAVEIERSGNDFFAHKTGFTQDSLIAMLNGCGFPYVYASSGNLEVLAYAFKNKPSEFAIKLNSLGKITDPLHDIPRQRVHSNEAKQHAHEMEASLLSSNLQDASQWVKCGYGWHKLDEIDRGINCFERALSIDSSNSDALNGMAAALQLQGNLSQSIEFSRRALEIAPSNNIIFQNLLFTMLCSGEVSEAEIYEWHRKFSQVFEKPLEINRSEFTNSTEPSRRLRVGYVSADLCAHVVGRCMAPILSHHDRENFDIYCYYNSNLADDFTRSMQAAGGVWRDMAKLNDIQLCKQIQTDRIDILVDLSGHTPGNRLLAFARKPAPIQVSYLDYSASTGMESMDYRLTGAGCDVEEVADDFYTEALVRLPGTYWFYTPPPPEVTDIAPLFDKQSGGLLLSCMNTFYRISDAAIIIWAEILRKLPTACLALVAVPTGNTRDKILARFHELGVEPSRIEMFGLLNYEHYFQLIRVTDIALAPFPYNGAMTMLDCLWSGVPVVCMRGGPTFRSSMGNCIYRLLALEELIANQADDYVNIVLRLAENPNLRLSLSLDLRERMRRSSICDAPALTAAIEAAYREMWHRYCGTR